MQKEASTITTGEDAGSVQPDMQYAGIEEVRSFQLNRIRESVDYLATNSPFYKQFFQLHQIHPTDIKTLDDLRRIPFTTKEHIQVQNDDFLCIPKNKVIDHCSTSGTLGEPVHILLSENDLSRLALNESLGLGLAGVGADDIIQLTTTMDKRFMAGLAYFLGARKLGAGIVRNGSGLPGMQWDTILRFKPTVIIAVPSFLLRMIDFAIENGINYRDSSVKKAICIGETIRNKDTGLSNLGERIISAWPIELYSTYASSEMQTCFTECSAGNGGHLLPELIYPEITDDEGNIIANGQIGELVITTFGIEGMPLLRYRTGDICSMETEPCACGRLTPRLMHISGRKMQMLKIKGTTLYPASVFNILDGCSFIENYITEAYFNKSGGDELKIYLSLKPGHDPLKLKIVEERLLEGLRLKPLIELRSVEEIQKLQFKEDARKPVKFVDLRTNDNN